MKFRRQFVVLVAALLMAGCSPSGAPTPTSTPETPPTTTAADPILSETPTPTPTTSPSASPTAFQSFPPPPADETAEQAAIREGWMNYWIVVDAFAKEPVSDDYTKTQEVTVAESEQSRAILDEIAHLKENGWRVVGHQILRDLTIGMPQFTGAVRTVELTYCYDGTALKVVSARSGLDAGVESPDFLFEQALFEEGKDGIWRASSIQNRREEC